MNSKSLDSKPSWFEIVFQLKGSVVITILPRILIFSGFATIICLLQYFDLPTFVQNLGGLTKNVVYNLVLGLLLVFRTNTSYDRFWDGRKALGIIVVNIRNLARFIRIAIPETSASEREEKIAVLKLLIAFALATKLQLREESADDEFKACLNSKQAQEIIKVKRPTLQISLWIGDYLQTQQQKKYIDSSQRVEMNNLLNNMIEGLSSCERISKTPLPIAYRIYLKRLILIYCLGLPLNLIENMQWWTVPTVAVVSFILLGLEAVGKELENPFGYDANDLPVDEICRNIIGDVEAVMLFSSENHPSLDDSSSSLTSVV